MITQTNIKVITYECYKDLFFYLLFILSSYFHHSLSVSSYLIHSSTFKTY